MPFWAKDPSIGNRMINARAETLAEKNAFKRAFREAALHHPGRRLLRVEGRSPGQKKKQPMYIHRADGEPLAFAGLWEVWRGPTAIRERAAALVHDHHRRRPTRRWPTIHDRMPVILPPSAWDAWLDPDIDDLDVLGKLLVPAPASLLTLHPVSTDGEQRPQQRRPPRRRGRAGR